MIPDELLNITELEEENYPSLTYKLDLTNKRITKVIDEQEAVMQAVQKIFLTERYANVIYNSDYGIELENLIGQDPVYVKVELKRRIEECLLEDERIQSVDNFNFVVTGDEMLCTFDVESIYGDLTVSKEVNI